MSYLRNAIYTSLRTAPRTIGKLFKSRRPQEGDEAAQRLTSRIMDVLEGYEVKQKSVSSGWMPDDTTSQDGSKEN
ncbi:MAG: hypothetical protein GY948_00970 [Alphaproteobacteria bacterium]|nr:hypothetical protein [Alphaproteobacteria bacterium]